MRSTLVTSLALVVLSVFVVVATPASDVEAASVDLASIFSSEPGSDCPTGESVCETWTPGCALGAHYVGREALEKTYGAESTVKPKDGNELFPMEWEVKHRGVLTPISCLLAGKNPQKSELQIPPTYHCAVALQADEHYYMMFFASNPIRDCVGWGECVCY